MNAQQNQDERDLRPWIKIHALIVGFEQLSRIVDSKQLSCLQTLLLVIFQLPVDRFLAFRYEATEII